MPHVAVYRCLSRLSAICRKTIKFCWLWSDAACDWHFLALAMSITYVQVGTAGVRWFAWDRV